MGKDVKGNAELLALISTAFDKDVAENHRRALMREGMKETDVILVGSGDGKFSAN